MAMKRCPHCGEKYSDTYKYCPFCEEEEGLRGSAPRRRSGGRRASSGGPNILSPILIVIIIILAALLLYLFFGESIRKSLAGNDDPAISAIGDASIDSSADTSSDINEPDIGGSGSSSTTGDSGQEEPVDVSALPETLTIAYLGSPRTEFSMTVGDDPIPLTVSGGSGTYQWSSSDDGIASVEANGNVTAVSQGKVTLTVTDGTGKGTCVVYIRGGSGQSGTQTSTGSSAALNKTDITIAAGEKCQLKVSGVTTALNWSSSDSGVAKVASDGTVTGVAAGTAKVTVSWDGNSKQCIVRVKAG